MTIAPDGRKLLRLEVRNSATPIERKPEWIRTRAHTGPQYIRAQGARALRWPAHGVPGGRLPQHLRVLGRPRGHLPHRRRPVHAPLRLLPDRHRQARRARPRRAAPRRRVACARWACATRRSPAWPATTCPTGRLAVRRDRPADPRAQPRHRRRAADPGLQLRRPDLLGEVFDARPEVLAHNLETVPRIFKRIRPAFRYDRSLDVITQARAAGLVTKSNLILGMGETPDEVTEALHDLHDAGCDLITITQYLRPSPRHHPVERWVKPRGVRRALRDRGGDRLRRRDVRAAGPLVLPGRSAVRPDGRASRRGALPRAGPSRAGGRRATGGTLAARPIGTDAGDRRHIVGTRPYPGTMPAKPKLRPRPRRRKPVPRSGPRRRRAGASSARRSRSSGARTRSSSR